MSLEIIAYYLPQYYPFKENNEWWGEGFTEWTNVGKAKPLYRNHYQPKVPADLGYYDLRYKDIKNKQIVLAKEAGVTAFCYWHYWFGGGKLLLEKPIQEVLKDKTLDFPFCFGWANESWLAKVWNTKQESKGKLLIEQLYPGIEDIIEHFNYVKPFIMDSRYKRIKGKPIFVVYKPLLHPDMKLFINTWNSLIKESGIADSFHFVGHTINQKEANKIMELGFDAVNVVRIGEHRFNENVIKKIPLKLVRYKLFNKPLKLNYSFISKYFIDKEIDLKENVYPTLIPNWDHTPRSGNKGIVFHDATPVLFKKSVTKMLNLVKRKENQIVFLKSWNEWGEGNYMEPCLKYGKGYINALKEAIDESFVHINN